MRGKRLAILLAGATALCLLGLAPWLSARASQFNLIGMLREIHLTNREIGVANGRILNSLESVGRQSEGVDRLRQRLESMQGLVERQQASLAELEATSAAQARLSQTLRELTAEIDGATADLTATSAIQADILQAMVRTTDGLVVRLAEIERLNRSAAGRLKGAEEWSALILQRMP